MSSLSKKPLGLIPTNMFEEKHRELTSLVYTCTANVGKGDRSSKMSREQTEIESMTRELERSLAKCQEQVEVATGNAKLKTLVEVRASQAFHEAEDFTNFASREAVHSSLKPYEREQVSSILI